MTGFAFTGEPRDANGLQYHRARYYNPSLAGWLSLDPVQGDMGHPMSLNGYLYVNGNPVMNIDPTGMFSRTHSLTPGDGGGSRRTRRTRRTRRPTRNRGTVRTRVPVRTTGASEVKTRSTTSPLVHGVPATVSSAAGNVVLNGDPSGLCSNTQPAFLRPQCRQLARSISKRYNIPLENLVNDNYEDLLAFEAVARLNDAAIIPNLIREYGFERPIEAVPDAWQEGLENPHGYTALGNLQSLWEGRKTWLAIVYEPADWAATGKAWLSGDFQPIDLLSFAPVITVASLRSLQSVNTGIRSLRMTGAYFEPAVGGAGLGKLDGVRIHVTERGIRIVEIHLGQFDYTPENPAMIARLRDSLNEGRDIMSADAVFYLHEISEATMMGRGLPYEVAHQMALDKYRVSPFSVYHPEVIQSLPRYFNDNWFRFWGIQR